MILVVPSLPCAKSCGAHTFVANISLIVLNQDAPLLILGVGQFK
jgi:hypothetical protein